MVNRSFLKIFWNILQGDLDFFIFFPWKFSFPNLSVPIQKSIGFEKNTNCFDRNLQEFSFFLQNFHLQNFQFPFKSPLVLRKTQTVLVEIVLFYFFSLKIFILKMFSPHSKVHWFWEKHKLFWWGLLAVRVWSSTLGFHTCVPLGAVQIVQQYS